VNSDAVPPHVLLLPGNMCDARLWQGGDSVITKAIEAQGLIVQIVDFKDDSTIEAMAARALGLTDTDIIPIGFSMGGIVALDMVRQAPDRIAAIGLIDTNSHADTRGPQRLRQQDDVRQGQLERVVKEELKPNYLAPCNRTNAALLTLLCDMAMDLGPDIFGTQSEALRTRDDLTPVLNDLKVPAFVACGAHDTLCPPSLHTDMARQIGDAQLHHVDDAGHILPLEQPAILAGLIAQFLISTRGPKP
jgi:pimeloyl-ACP methyl ester carboxylesterase